MAVASFYPLGEGLALGAYGKIAAWEVQLVQGQILPDACITQLDAQQWLEASALMAELAQYAKEDTVTQMRSGEILYGNAAIEDQNQSTQ